MLLLVILFPYIRNGFRIVYDNSLKLFDNTIHFYPKYCNFPNTSKQLFKKIDYKFSDENFFFFEYGG